jgi:hypothetical protein
MRITQIMAYYDNPTMLKLQLENIAAYPKEIKDRLELIIIDDASPRWPAHFELNPGIPMKLYRTKIDIPWNQDFCRNLGAYQANTDWLLLTDMDHLVPLNTMQAIIEKMEREILKLHVAYRFDRVSAPDMQPYKLHPNSWLIAREFYCLIGGYDERFAGYYGTDGDFRDRINKFTIIEQIPYPLIRVGRETVADASTTTYQRKKPEDGIAITRIKKERGNQPPKILTFEWEEVYKTDQLEEPLA